ncbi:16S rRNA (uracil(1498)-N(3))-methyltransferase [Porphyromonas sp.]|uniref:16S rRNA (uracil(1498)-N(3))-methyltransferase n=1 Tax=Porphyromonas sp. TaxID=1924944 RepID=UPI0026DAA7C0|nr:16S rRNA (uracil(1498)-N(3))-methyltransferase [Porphyromonas sp.]MDO4771601.1 16S rRNA (uracil(1498)-N(3))-methyltransferase [Porphyromonas sp.]
MSKKKQRSKGSEDTTYFYAPEIESTGVLPPEESAHAIRVLRLKEGDRIFVTDGKGSLYQAVILSTDPKETAVSIESTVTTYNKRTPSFHLAIAPTKNIDRIEWMIEKLTEIGLDRISILNTEHTVRRQVNTDRLQKIIVSAMKQSRKLVLPRLDKYDSLSAFLADIPDSPQRYIAHCDESSERRELKEHFVKGQDAVFLIGPEGDFSPKEVEQALAAGFVPVTLGEERLRTETAGLYVGFLHHLYN